MVMEDEEKMLSGQSDSGGGGQEAEREIENFELSGKEEAKASEGGNFEIKKSVEDVFEDESHEGSVMDASKPDENKGTMELEEKLLAMTEGLKKSTEAQRDLEKKVIQTLKENVNFQIQVRQNMKKELEEAHKKLSGDIFIPLLKEIAELYIEWQDVLNDMEQGTAKNKVNGIFEILKDILEENGCEFGTSDIDTKRRPRYSKLKDKVSTGEKERHETVARSYNPWIVKEPFVLYPEKVDVYVYDEKLDPALTSGQSEKGCGLAPQDELDEKE